MKKISLVRAGLLISLVLIPCIEFAVAAGSTASSVTAGFGSLSNMINSFTSNVVKAVASLLLALALVAFFYGIVEYIWAKRKGDAPGVKSGNQFMTWGLVALFVMFSVYGIIKLAQNVLGMSGSTETIVIPNINFGTGSSPNDPTNPNNPPSPTDPTNPPNPSGKATGATCVNSSECASNFCGTDSKCQIISGTNKKPNTYACTYSDECTSGFCDPADNTCSPKVVGDGGLGEGVGCVDTPQCATGLTCIGSNSTNRVCTSGGGSSGSCKGNTGGVNCGCDTDCNGTYKCLESYCVDPQG